MWIAGGQAQFLHEPCLPWKESLASEYHEGAAEGVHTAMLKSNSPTLKNIRASFLIQFRFLT